MVDPKRWLHDEGAPHEVVQLLRATRRPSAASRAKRMALMAMAAGAAVQAPRAAWGLAGFKAALYSSALVVTGAAVILVARHRTPEPPREPPAVMAAVSAPSAPGTPQPSTFVVEPPPVAAPTPASTQRHPGASAHIAVRPKAGTTDTLAEEEALLEGARRELTRSPRESLKLLQKHQQRFPNGELTAERLFLGTDAAVRLGDAATAHQMADALVLRFPNSAYARRAPALLGSLSSGSSR
jgi:hypothetical protein